MRTPLGTEVDLGPGNIVLDGVLAPRERGTAAPPSFRPMSIVATVAHLSYCRALVKFLHKQTEQWICSKLSLKMSQYLKCLATVPSYLSLITISVSNCFLFCDISISQGNVATRLRYGRIFSYQSLYCKFIAEFNSKEFSKSAKIWQSYCHEFDGLTFGTQCRFTLVTGEQSLTEQGSNLQAPSAEGFCECLQCTRQGRNRVILSDP